MMKMEETAGPRSRRCSGKVFAVVFIVLGVAVVAALLVMAIRSEIFRAAEEDKSNLQKLVLVVATGEDEATRIRLIGEKLSHLYSDFLKEKRDTVLAYCDSCKSLVSNVSDYLAIGEPENIPINYDIVIKTLNAWMDVLITDGETTVKELSLMGVERDWISAEVGSRFDGFQGSAELFAIEINKDNSVTVFAMIKPGDNLKQVVAYESLEKAKSVFV